MKRALSIVAVGLAGGSALFFASTLGSPQTADPSIPAVVADDGSVPPVEPRIPASGSVDDLISSLRVRVETLPTDHVAWATLGLAYVQQAKLTVDSTYYLRADEALAASLDIDRSENYLAYAGLSTLASARHDFVPAREYAEQGLEINPYSAILYGTLSDALLQMGRYDEAFAAIQQMVDLSPDTASLTRASYAWELRGDVTRARSLMQRALDDAPAPADRSFALAQLGGLAFGEGDASAALRFYNSALEAFPGDIAALAGKARAEAALGQVETALDDYADVVAQAPEPAYVIEYARLLESTGRPDEAAQQYVLFDEAQAQAALDGVQPDAPAMLFYADRGDVEQAISGIDRLLETRPFVVLHDARAWALHNAGRHDEALDAIDEALELGTRSALFHFHAGMIAHALGDAERARVELIEALTINPEFDPLSADIARETLASLEAIP